MTRRVWLSTLCLGTALCASAATPDAQQPTGPPTLTTEFGELEIFPADNRWNQDVSKLPVHPRSEAWLDSVGRAKPPHPDLGIIWKGLPPGLVRYDEVAVKKSLRHAVRFTVRRTQRGYIPPATHFASRSDDPDLPPMGMRVRLKAGFDTRGFPPQARVILEGLKRYGMMLADNGGDFFITGAADPRWDHQDIETLKRVKVSDFEVVDTGQAVRR